MKDRRPRAWVAIAFFATFFTFQLTTLAEEAPVPSARQAELVARVAAYDRHLSARAGGTVRVLIVMNQRDADSRQFAGEMADALRRIGTIGGMPVEISTLAYIGPAELLAACKNNHTSLVYLAQEPDSTIPEIVHALDGLDVLTVTAIPRFVTQGVVLGFGLTSGRPYIFINLPQARKQNVDFDARVLALAEVIK